MVSGADDLPQSFGAGPKDSDYNPWDYRRQDISIDSLAQRHSRHIQPPSGTEKAFGQALREIRKSRNLSQEQLALDSDFDRTYVSLLERGLKSPTVRTIVKLAATLDVPPSVMIRRMERILGLTYGRKEKAPIEVPKKR